MNNSPNFFNNYRIVEMQNLNGNIIFVPQERKFLFFWVPFMEMSMFPKRIEFETIQSALKFLNRQIEKPKDKLHYY